jgi:hypothetical protein
MQCPADFAMSRRDLMAGAAVCAVAMAAPTIAKASPIQSTDAQTKDKKMARIFITGSSDA